MLGRQGLVPGSFYKQCLYGDVSEVPSFMNGECWWHMGSSAEPKTNVRKEGEGASWCSAMAGRSDVSASLSAWTGARVPAEPGRKGRVALSHQSFWEDRADNKTTPFPLPISSSVPSASPPSQPCGSGRRCSSPRSSVPSERSMAGSPEQDGWECSRSGSLGTLAKINPG